MAAFANDTLPDGWLACDGTAVNRTTYANLFSKIGTTYGAGDGSATFNLPNLTDKFIQGNNTAGTVKSAGLPNITGYLSPLIYGGYEDALAVGGAFQIRTAGKSGFAGNIDTPTGGTNLIRGYDLNASRSSSIYGNSTTVQPPALTMRFAIFAGHSALHRWIRTV